MNIVVSTTPPKEGQFVAVWYHNNEVWSDTYKIEGGEVFVYDGEEGEFSPTSYPIFHRASLVDDVTYIQYVEE